MVSTAFARFTLDEAWYVWGAVSPILLQDCQHEEYARGLTQELGDAILFMSDAGEADASVELHAPEILIIMGAVKADDKDADGNPIGMNVLLQLMHCRASIESDYPLAYLPACDDDLDYSTAVNEAGGDGLGSTD